MSDITVINDSQQSDLVTNGLAKNGELYLKASGSTDEGAIVVYDNGSWRTFANEAGPSFTNAYSVQLDGTDDRVLYDSTSGNQSSLGSFTGDMSFVFWFRQTTIPSGLGQDYKGIMSSFHTLTAADGVQGKFDMDTYQGTTLRVFSRDSNAGGFTATSAGTLSAGNWNFVAYVADTAASEHYVYLGTTSSSPSLAHTISTTQTLEDFSNGFKLGQALQNNITGLMDDFAIFDGKALSSSEITTIYNSAVSFDYSTDSSLNPVGWYRMGDDNSGTGTLVQNAVNTGSSYDAELQNGAAFTSTVY